MTEFFCDMVEREAGVNWARAAIREGGSEVAEKNARQVLQWLKEALTERLDLAGKDLRGESFRGKNLDGADLSSANLEGVGLAGASLRGALLKGTPVRLWEASSGRQLRRFHGHSSSVLSVVFSSGGEQLASGSYDHTMRQWEVASGRELRRFHGHSSSVLSVAFSSGGEQLASGSYDNTVRLGASCAASRATAIASGAWRVAAHANP